jgi:hypothetical protein
MGDITKNFSLSEFARCREGLQDLPHEVEQAITYRLAPKLQYLRDRIGRPIRITSGYRSEAYNARIGGSKTSRHVYGLAADIDVANMGADELAQLDGRPCACRSRLRRQATARRETPQATVGQLPARAPLHNGVRTMKARKLRAVGRMLIRGTREELVEALDELIEPKSRLWERVSDIAVGYVVDVLLEGREELVAGMREVLDELESPPSDAA